MFGLANARHQLTGIEIWTPDQKYIQMEEPAPDDLFAVPLQPLANLRRFNVESTLNQRVRTSGTVVLAAPGHYVYVQDGLDSVLALSQQTNTLQPGDQVEVVGFPGEEDEKLFSGKRFIVAFPMARAQARTTVGNGCG